MQKIYGNKVPKLELEYGSRKMFGTVDKDGEWVNLTIVCDDNANSFTLDSLHDIALLRDFVRRAERLMKDSIKIKK